jgi:hypothetical protein
MLTPYPIQESGIDISFAANNGGGGTCSGQVTVSVPYSSSGPAVDGGALYDSTKP